MTRLRLLAAALAVTLTAAAVYFLWPRPDPLTAAPEAGSGGGGFYYTGPIKAKDGKSWGLPGGGRTAKPEKPVKDYLIKL